MNTHTTPDSAATTQQWCTYKPAIMSGMIEAFSQYSLDNRNALKSSQAGSDVAETIFEQITQYLNNELSQFDIAATASALAKQGLALTTASHMMRVILPQLPVEICTPSLVNKLNEFQLIFLEKLAETREVVQLRAQEESQIALQQALYTQLEQQRQLRESVERHSSSLNQILQLNASLTRATTEVELLDEAVSGICQALDLDHVSIYEKPATTADWMLRTTTAANAGQVDPQEPQVAELLRQIAHTDGEFVRQHQVSQKIKGLSIVIPFTISIERRGSLIAVSTNPDAEEERELPILLRTFGQGLTTIWHNLSLLMETSQRAHELEILHGRYVDTIWSGEDTALQANFDDSGLHINRRKNIDTPAIPDDHSTIPLRIGERAFGHIDIPGDIPLNEDDQAFIEELAKEMGTALNNAYLLQTTRAYSNQLQVASEVSRAATTILNPDILIQETVDLIQTRFNFYYVGLFLVDDLRKTAVLEAGTGQAGREQLARKHRLDIGGSSMIGTAIAGNRAIIEQDVAQAAYFTPNPLLPNTRSELALPLRSHGDVIGAITVQSVQIGAFTPETVTVLQNLADQLATAIVNADLLTQVQTNLAETSRLYESGRLLSETRTRADVYNVLLDFTSQSNLFDFAQVIVVERSNPDFLARPAQWSRRKTKEKPLSKIARQDFPFEAQLNNNEIILLKDVEKRLTTMPALGNLMASEDVQTIVFIPIYAEGTWLGALAIQAVNDLAINTHDMQPFRTLADQAAITIVNQQLLRQAELLYRIGHSLSQALTRDDALEITVSEISSYTGTTQCRIVLYDEQTEQGRVITETIPSDASATARFEMAGDFVYDYLNSQRQPLLLSETEAEIPANVLEQYVTQFGAASTLIIPLASQQDLIGFLTLDAASKRPFTSNNIIFAQTVVDHLTTQLENLKLLDEALTRAQELIFLNQIQSSISSILDVKQLAHVTYQQVGRLLDTTIFIMAQYDDKTNVFTTILAIKNNTEIPIPPHTLTPAEPLHKFLQDNLPVITDAASPLLSTIPILADAQSGLWVPLQRENKPSGLICALSRQPRAYHENDGQLLRSIATQASLAIENARLFERIQENIEELRQLDNMKNQFLANMSHELRTPLNSIIGFSRVILKGIDGPLTTEQEEDLTSIYNNGQHLLNLINEILDMAKIEAGKMNLAFEQVDLGEAAKATLTNIRSLIKPNVELISDIESGLPTIEADPIRIRQILINLLSNAAKFTDEGYINLKVARVDEDHLSMTVTDTGLGIADEDMDKLFKAFEQADNSTTRTAGGTGLGLPITLWLVRMHNGTMSVDTQYGKGTTFTVRLPLVQPEEKRVVAFNT
ncbi:MAG: GAF domain-containing protein [Anaerolineae bacterium]|nr:GAF domain-containing protein [Anaerolineae bacterium]